MLCDTMGEAGGYRESGREPLAKERLDITELAWQRLYIPILQLGIGGGALLFAGVSFKNLPRGASFGSVFLSMVAVLVGVLVLRFFYLPRLTHTVLVREEGKMLRVERRLFGRLIELIEVPFTATASKSTAPRLTAFAYTNSGERLGLIREHEKKSIKRWVIELRTDDGQTVALGTYRSRERVTHHVDRIASFLEVLSAQTEYEPLISRMHPPHNDRL